MDWGSSVHAKVVAYNVYGDSDESPVGNGAIILTNPDAPVNLAEVSALRAADAITIRWEDGVSDGGIAVIDYRLSSDQSIGSFVVVTDGITSTQYTVTGLLAGETYQFKIESRNSYGYSIYSDTIDILCATKPDVPGLPTTAVVADQVVIDWNAPSENGLVIESYTVVIQQSDGVYSQQLTYCDGTDSAITAATECTIPLDVLRASPYSLSMGEAVYVKVLATNAYGSSAYSDMGFGAIVVLVPDAP